MSDLPLRTLRDLELRFDGPIPAQHRSSEQAARRRARGTIAVLEAQGTQFLDQAVRCESECEDLAADLKERSFSRWQREAGEKRLAAINGRATAHIESAARALQEAASLRRALTLPAHPLVRLAALLDPEATSDPT